MTQCTYLEAHTTFETRVWTHEQRPNRGPTTRRADMSTSVISTGAARRDTLGRRIAFNWWREYVMNHYTGAELHWLRLRDSGEAINTGTVAGASPETAYCQLSDQEFRQLRPRPTLKETLLELAGQRDFYVNS